MGSHRNPVEDGEPCPENTTMLEAFEWYCPPGRKFWTRLQAASTGFKSIGIDNLWIPPACKASSPESNGYDIYDIYDLGEFNQKGSIETKWGTKEELLEMIKTCNDHGLGIYFDVVINHKASADFTVPCRAVRVKDTNRLEPDAEPEDIEPWLGFNFEGRNGKYSTMKYNAEHFNGVDFDQKSGKHGIYKLLDSDGKDWANDVDKENGNYDFLLCGNLYFRHSAVREDLRNWVQWLGGELNLAGLRIDAVKHMSQDFMLQYVQFIDRTVGKDWFIVGEYSTDYKIDTLKHYIEKMQHRMSLFDFPLHRNLLNASHNEDYDLRDIFNNTLAQQMPKNAVTFVTNHDTQERNYAFETKVAPHFIPVAYALILLTESTGYPCVFYGDLYGAGGPDYPRPVTCWEQLPKLILARKLFAYGPQTDYFNRKNCIGFTRAGHPSRAKNAGLAVLATNSKLPVVKRMKVGRLHRGEHWTDILGWTAGTVTIDRAGYGTFPCVANSVSVWVDAAADGRDKIDGMEFDTNFYAD